MEDIVVKRIANTPKTRVELHAHLDGCVRLETMWELMKEKNITLPGNGTFRDFREAIIVTHPIDLGHFLEPFGIFLPCVQDDMKAIERIAYEFCEDKSRNNVAYVEARYSPHGLLTLGNQNMDNLKEVVRAVNRGLQRGEADFEIKARAILCTLIGDNTSEEVLKLCESFRNENVVGIDIASKFDKANQQDEVPLDTVEVQVYQEAVRLGIHRTIHAGERGPSEMVRRAVEVYQTERVGHGYHVLEDLKIYQLCKDKNIHFECCPWSSFLTGAVPLATEKHPIVQFAEDNFNFSLNTDDTTITGRDLDEDYKLAGNWSFTEAHYVRTNLNAAKSCFLPTSEKNDLIQLLKTRFGFEDI